MPLQSSGIIVVEKPPAVISSTTGSGGVKQKTTPSTCQIYEYYDTSTPTSSDEQQKILNNNLIRRQRTLSSSQPNAATNSSSFQKHNVQPSYQQHHQQVLHGQQVQIVSEEYLEQAAAAGTVINISSDVLNQTQFIKFVSADAAGNVILDSSPGTSSSASTNGHQQNQSSGSKVLTVLKQQPAAGQHQINFVNAKGLPSYTTSSSICRNQTVQKILNIPIKTTNVVKTIHQSQKVGVGGNVLPRNVQVVTRVGGPAGSPQNQMLVQQKYIHNVVCGPTSSTTKLNNSNSNNLNLIKKQHSAPTIKVQQHKVINNQIQGGVKTFIHQQPQQPQQQIYVQQPSAPLTPTKMKSQKIIKQYNNAINNNTSTVSVATISGVNKLNQQTQLQTPVVKKHSKYVMQNHYNNNNNQLIPPSPHKITNANNNNTVILNHQQYLNSSAPSGTIKFVNAQGTVIQQQQQTTQAPTILQAKRPTQQQPQQIIQYSSSSQSKTTESSPNIYHISTSYIQQQQQQQNSTANAPTQEEVMIVNGTQMTDEISARILQNMSQKTYQPPTRYPQKITSMPPPQQPPSQQIQLQQYAHSTSNTPTNIILSTGGAILPPTSATSGNKDYTIYSGTTINQKQARSTPNSRSQSLERKELKKLSSAASLTSSTPSAEYFQVNSKDLNQSNFYKASSTIITTSAPTSLTTASTSKVSTFPYSSTTTTFIDNIPLPIHSNQRKNVGNNQDQQNTQDQDDVIGEEVRPHPVDTMDARLHALYAFQQDHTYPISIQSRLPTDFPKILPTQSVTTSTTVPETVVTSTTPGAGTTYTIFGQQIPRPPQDDDANSLISNGSRNGTNDNDLGEETETAPEAEAEDDSITRCICDLTHDDGYMICCDKCSCWQHVDCMGIDRQNIPEEYLCELCQPRPVDKPRARSLQLIKRKEQQQMLINSQLNNLNGALPGGLMPSDVKNPLLPHHGGPTSALSSGSLSNLNTSSPANMLSSPLATAKKGSKLTKRKELIKKIKKEKPIGKKRENNKKITKKKIKNTSAESIDKHTANLRQWIENYEVAVTNHYSPELRARLHSIGKQNHLLNMNSARNYGNLDKAATTVPHAGGKILISNFEIQPNMPIIELRGKYMLNTQYKIQNPTINMNSPPPSNYFLQSLKAHKTPGPFIFFYQWTMDSILPVTETNYEMQSLNLSGVSGPEICVDTRTYGNDARFVRRSCRPNAVLQHSFEKGTIHLYIVALTKIMASTEITIRHEPHDLIAIESKKSTSPSLLHMHNFSNIQPTSTSCACGLTKDCLFGAPPPTNTPLPLKPTRSKVFNGSKKNIIMSNRNRSTSSSGESNTGGMLSPNINNNNTITFATQNIYNSAASISSLLHDSGIYTSSSSPSVSIPSPTQPNINPPAIFPTTVILPPPAAVQPLHPPTLAPPMLSPVPVIATEPESVQVVPPPLPTPPLPTPPIVAPIVAAPVAPTLPEETPLASPEIVPISVETHHEPQNSPKKTPSKRTTSLSENDQTDEPSQKEGEKRESRKLTREERKMEAIVRAFEKLEKTQQKKNDCKHSKRSNSGSPSPKRTKIADDIKNLNCPNARKKKKTKVQRTGSNSIKKQRKNCGNESDILNTSEESSTAILSPLPCQTSNCFSDDSLQMDTSINKAADLLLSFAHTDKCLTGSTNAPLQSESLSNASPTPHLSSTCLLVEAAVAPLESPTHDFKLPPTQARTKKTLMNNWFNNQNSVDYNHLLDSPTLHQPVEVKEEPTNLALKKVEEFLTQAEQQSPVSVAPTPPNTLSLQVSTCCNNSSVKKRWLRQAISEESTTESVDSPMPLTASPTSSTTTTPTTPNGFMTPLKKRRLLISSSISGDYQEENSSSNHDHVLNSSLIEPKEEIENGDHKPVMDVEDDVDIMRSPSPGTEKIVAEDNQVKIEPEDVTAPDVPIDVEKEEENTISIKSEEVKKEKAEDDEEVDVAIKEETIENIAEEEKHVIQVKIENIEIKKEDDKSLVKLEEEPEVKEETFDVIEPLAKKPKLDLDGSFNQPDSNNLEDILHSFHKENIMILQSRNKKSTKSPQSGSSPTSNSSKSSGKKSSRKDSKKHSSKSSKDSDKKSKKSSSSTSNKKDDKKKSSSKHRSSSKSSVSSKKRHLNFDDPEIFENSRKPSTKSGSGANSSSSSRSSSHERNKHRNSVNKNQTPEPPIFMADEKHISSTFVENPIQHPVKTEKQIQSNAIAEKQIQAALTIPSFNHNVHPVLSSLSISFNVPSVNTSPTTCQSNTSLFSPPHSSTRQSLPYYNTIYSKFNNNGLSESKIKDILEDKPNNSLLPPSSCGILTPSPSPSSTNILTSDYLEAKAKTFNSLGGIVQHSMTSAFFALNSSPVTSASVSSTGGSEKCSTEGSLTPSKIMTKTACHDPRLNPILTAPEPVPTPKRKLSINEYRKRKQQSLENALSAAASSPSINSGNEKSIRSFLNGGSALSSLQSVKSIDLDNNETKENNDKLNSIESNSSLQMLIDDDTSKVQFNAAPTLLEKQQEILCERLKSLKNLHSSLGFSSLASPSISDNFAAVRSPTFLLSKDELKLSTKEKISFDFDNSLEAISSTSTSPISSRSSTPDRLIRSSSSPLTGFEDKNLDLSSSSTINVVPPSSSVASPTHHQNVNNSFHDSISSLEDITCSPKQELSHTIPDNSPLSPSSQPTTPSASPLLETVDSNSPTSPSSPPPSPSLLNTTTT